LFGTGKRKRPVKIKGEREGFIIKRGRERRHSLQGNKGRRVAWPGFSVGDWKKGERRGSSLS